MAGLFDESFGKLQSRLNEMENKILKEINSQKRPVESKDNQIKDLIQNIDNLKSKIVIITNIASQKEC